MPGPPIGSSKPIAESSNAHVIGLFIVCPILAGAAILSFTAMNALAHASEFTAGDWFWQVGWMGLLSLGVMIVIPAVGWRELRRRLHKKSV